MLMSTTAQRLKEDQRTGCAYLSALQLDVCHGVVHRAMILWREADDQAVWLVLLAHAWLASARMPRAWLGSRLEVCCCPT